MKFQFYFLLLIFTTLSAIQWSFAENLTFPNAKFDQAKASFKTISQIIFKLGQSKIPNPYEKDINAISQVFNNKKITDKNLESILSKLGKIENGLLGLDQNTKVSLPAGFGKSTEKTLGNFLATSYNKLKADLKLVLNSTKKVTDAIKDEKGIQLIKDSFTPIFFGFFKLFEHYYYDNLDKVRVLLHEDLNKDKLILIRDIMELLSIELNDENQNQTMRLELEPEHRYDVNVSGLRGLIKTYINNVNALIK